MEDRRTSGIIDSGGTCAGFCVIQKIDGFAGLAALFNDDSLEIEYVSRVVEVLS